MPITSMEQIVQTVKSGALLIQQGFSKPDDDWDGMMMFVTEEAQHVLPLSFKNEFEKNVITEFAIPALIREVRPWMIVQVQSAWVVEGKRKPGEAPMEELGDLPRYEDIGMDVPPSQHPDRKEALILVAQTVEQEQMWTAEIKRHKRKPPTLGSWRLHNDLAGTSGRFISPIRQALKEVNE